VIRSTRSGGEDFQVPSEKKIYTEREGWDGKGRRICANPIKKRTFARFRRKKKKKKKKKKKDRRWEGREILLNRYPNRGNEKHAQTIKKRKKGLV